MKKIAIINQKGGVGKSTVSVNLSYALAMVAGESTLLADLDPQAQSGSIYVPSNVPYTTKDLFADPRFDITKAINKALVNDKTIENLDVIRSNIHLAKVAEQVSSRIHREKILHNHLRKLKYSYLVADCPPNLGVITVNAIYMADLILIPINYDKGALDGMADLIGTIEEVKESNKFPYLILRNEYDIRNKQTNAYIESELAPFKEKVLNIRIRKSESLNQSRITNEPVYTYASQANGVIDYNELTTELTKYVQTSK